MDLIFIRGEINERESMNSIWILEKMEKKKKRFWREDFDCNAIHREIQGEMFVP